MNKDNFSLSDLLSSLQKEASDDEKEKKDDKDDKDKPAFLKSKDEKSDDDKKEGKKEDKEEQEKEASIAAAILQKTASFTNTVNSEENMNQSQAVQKGEALAAQLLEKLASVGDQSTTNGIPAGVVPNKTQVDLAAQVAEDDAKIQGQPGAGGTINQIFDAVVADTLAQGAAPLETVGAGTYAAGEGRVESAIPNQVKTASDEIEKLAAATELVRQGYDFFDAVDMVKEAANQIEAEESFEKAAAISSLINQGMSFEDAVTQINGDDNDFVKSAALQNLLEQGVDFESAVEMVKEASVGTALRGVATAAKRGFRSAASGAKIGAGGAAHTAGAAAGKATSAIGAAGSSAADKARLAAAYAKTGYRTSGSSARAAKSSGSLNRTSHAAGSAAGKAVNFAKTNPYTTAGVGAGAAVAAGGTAYAMHKKAAFDGLVEMGYDTFDAANLVNAKAEELYGE